MIRVVTTVLVAVALLAVSMPAIEDARTETTVERIGTQADRIERVAGETTASSVAVVDADLAGRRSMIVSAPTGVATAPVDRIALEEPEDSDAVPDDRAPHGSVVVAYRLRHGSTRAVAIPPPTDAAEFALVDGPIELRPDGETRLELRVVDRGGPTVRIERVG